MKKNVGVRDRVARFFVASVLLISYFTGTSSMEGSTCFFLGIIFILTSLFGFCPFYELYGMNSYDLENDETK